MSCDHLLEHRHGDRASESVTDDRVLDFSVNLAPVEPPLQELIGGQCSIASYPSMDGRRVRDFYAARFGLNRECILATNGAIEGLYLLPRALRLRRVLVPQPSFFDYGRACRLAGAEVVTLRLEEDTGFPFPGIELLAALLEGCDALFMGCPNNPTGTMMPKEQFLALACRFPDKYIIVDEAFIQFTEGFPQNSLMPEVMALPNIIVVHSLTKFYSIAGLRLGAIVAHPAMIGRLYEYKEPWTVNAVAEQAAGLLLDCGEHEEQVRSIVSEGRRQIAEALERNPAIRLYCGSANFFFASVREGWRLDALLPFLGSRGILVRDCRNFEGLHPSFFRFCIRTVDQNSVLIEALNDFASSDEYPGASREVAR
ncbi:MAG: threonine-phosphate decarboxylase [Chlorobiaceae bacterium]|nr:threonine-phosphate decarboxylase [Chlorobiaceae bacterium]